MWRAVRHLRIAGFDTSTAAGRTSERYRLAAWAALSSVVSRAVSMVLLVLAVYLTTPYLGSTRFGIWATFSSMAAMLSLLDLGVGNALVNRVAHATARGDDTEVQTAITGGCGILAAIGVAAALLLSLASWLLPWGVLFKLEDAAVIAEAQRAGSTFAIFFGVNLFSSGLLRILAGQQRSHAANLVTASGSAFACLALWIASGRQADIPSLIAVTFGLQSLVSLTAGLLLRRGDAGRRPGLWSAMKSERPQLMRTGLLFMLLQVGTMVGWGSDSIILASLKGASEVAVYAIGLRLFQFASQPFALLNAPLWAAYADACIRRDTDFVRGTLKRSLTVSLIGCTVASSLLLFASGWIVPAWTQGAIAVPATVLLLFAVWTILDTTGNAFGIYLNGCGIVRQQVWVVLAFCCAALPLKFFLGHAWGASGILAATIISYTLVVVGLYGGVLRAQILRPLAASAP